MIRRSIFCVISAVGCLTVASCASQNNTTKSTQTVQFPTFIDVSEKVGLVSEVTTKYGGPSVSDINGDGHYDFVLSNHTAPIQLFLADGDFTYSEKEGFFISPADVHGVSAGDYDLDGDNDILISLGGGNGTSPQPQRLLQNQNGKFVDVTVESGISKMGARGRAVRWIDMDADGDLDFMQVNAEKFITEFITEDVPRNVLFENMGDGTFKYRKSPAFEDMDAERALLTDLNNDGILDLIAMNGYQQMSVWQGVGDFIYKDVSATWLPEGSDNYRHTIAVAHADIDNDGDLDYYLARGLLLYGLADNSISYNKKTGRLDLRDEGNKSHDGISLKASGDITLTDFFHFPRGKKLDKMPVFLGKNASLIDTPEKASITITPEQAEGFPETVENTGWYIGYLGDGNWRMEWKLVDDLAWGLRASVVGLDGYTPDWTPNNSNIPDVLLRNDGDRFTDISSSLPAVARDYNNWGVEAADFNNDGKSDFFVHRFGELRERIPDVVVMNLGEENFAAEPSPSATTEIGRNSHGDMGTAFDYNHDGKIDILNGDDDDGQWHLYENTSEEVGNYLLAHVGYSKNGTDPMSAKIYVTSPDGTQFKIIGSASATHSQSLLNISHFGIAANKHVDIRVEWRDGTSMEMKGASANQMIKIGKFK